MVRKDDSYEAFDIVRMCARSTAVPDEWVQSIQARSGTVDWERVARQAYVHGVHPLVYHALQQVDASAVPAAVWTWFQETGRAVRAWNRFGVEELDRVNQLLEREGIPALVLKGPVLAHLAYGDIGLRHSVDLDVLVRPADMKAIDALLLEKGYRRLNADSSPLRRRIRFLFEKEHHYARGELVYNVDVHAAAVAPSFAYGAPFDVLYQRAGTVTIEGLRFMTPSVEDLIQLLCYHGAKDRWARLKRVCDVNELVQSHLEIDWDAVLARAEQLQAERVLCLGLLLVRQVFNTQLPSFVTEFAARHPSMGRWATVLAARLPRRIDQSAWGSLAERITYPLAIQDTLRHKARYATYAGLRKALVAFDE